MPAALADRISVTPANVNDGRASDAALRHDPDDVFADGCYCDAHARAAVLPWNGTSRTILAAMWGRDEQDTLGRADAGDL
jgi:IS5 family transposase